MIAQLRQSLRALERPTGLEDGPGVLPTGIAAIDAALGGGLARGALHEIAAAGEAHAGAAAGFALGLASLPSPRLRGEGGEQRSCEPGEGAFPQAQNCGYAPLPARRRFASAVDLSPPAGRGERKSLVWIAEEMALAESGAPYGPGLDAFGLAPERLLTIAAANMRDLLWAMEEALRCRAVGAVIGEVRHGEIDSVAVRRLSLAAGQGGALALLLRASPPRDASTATTRWIAGAAPHDCFAVELTRNRRGPLGAWTLQWSNEDERFVPATHAQPVAAPAADRPHRKVA
jgi:protein ImuA